VFPGFVVLKDDLVYRFPFAVFRFHIKPLPTGEKVWQPQASACAGNKSGTGVSPVLFIILSLF
jgi:hypothetical protein